MGGILKRGPVSFSQERASAAPFGSGFNSEGWRIPAVWDFVLIPQEALSFYSEYQGLCFECLFPAGTLKATLLVELNYMYTPSGHVSPVESMSFPTNWTFSNGCVLALIYICHFFLTHCYKCYFSVYIQCNLRFWSASSNLRSCEEFPLVNHIGNKSAGTLWTAL